jgi:hypothetical protein
LNLVNIRTNFSSHNLIPIIDLCLLLLAQRSAEQPAMATSPLYHRIPLPAFSLSIIKLLIQRRPIHSWTMMIMLTHCPHHIIRLINRPHPQAIHLTKVVPVHLCELSTITKHKNKTNYHLNKVNCALLELARRSADVFLLGDVFTKLEDEDDQGWCTGRVGNRVGLYPATYVESL